MKIAIDLDCLLHNGNIRCDIINYELFDKLKQLKNEHELTLRVNLTDFSYSDLNVFLSEHNMENWFESVEVVYGAAQYLVTNRAITAEQFMLITDGREPNGDLFQEAVSWNQSQDKVI